MKSEHKYVLNFFFFGKIICKYFDFVYMHTYFFVLCCAAHADRQKWPRLNGKRSTTTSAAVACVYLCEDEDASYK